MPSLASAANNYQAAHGVLYIPVESVTLVPASLCPIPQGGDDNPGLGCSNLVSEETTFDPVANVDEIVAGVTDALAPYGVIVTTTRPPFWVPYQMVIPREDEDPKSMSASCAIATTDCDGIDRGDIAFTVGGTAMCTDPDPVQTVLIAFGRLAGLEGKDNPGDVMAYPPDFTAPVTTFVDACDAIVTPENPDTGLPMPLLCPASYHEASGMCVQDDNQNSHNELLAVYGPALPVDTTPPEIGDVTGAPMQDDVLPANSFIELSVPVTDDSGVVAVRIAIESPALEVEYGVPDGLIDKCIGGACGVRNGGDTPPQALEFLNGSDMAYPDASMPFEFNELASAPLPDGDYTITVEASDLAGNLAVPIVRNFSVGDGTVDTGGDDTTTRGSSSGDDGPSDDGLDVTTEPGTTLSTSFTEDGDDGDDDDDDTNDDDDEDTTGTGDAGAADDEIIDRGCGCTTAPRGATPLLLVGLVGLAARRRRKSGSRQGFGGSSRKPPDRSR